MNISNNKCCTITSQRFLTTDLILLNEKERLSLELLVYFSSLQNKSIIDSFITSMTNLVALNCSGKLHDNIKDWKERNISSVCIIMNFGKDKVGDTYLAEKTWKRTTRHACFWISLVEYCGTAIFLLGRLQIITKLSFLTSTIKTSLKQHQIIFVRSRLFTIQRTVDMRFICVS